MAALIDLVIQTEKANVDDDATNVFLGGFSMGAIMAFYTPLMTLDYNIGGVIAFSGYPLPALTALIDMDTADAQAEASYYGSDMRFMLWHGSEEELFPAD